MSDATCKTCPWCQELLASIDGLDGECHKNAPTVDGETAHIMRMPVGSALWPLVSMGRDWCGEHPDRQPVFLAEVKTAETKCLTRGDVITIVAQQIETEMKARKR